MADEGLEIAKKVERFPFNAAQRANGGVGIDAIPREDSIEYMAQGTGSRNRITIDMNPPNPQGVSLVIDLDSLQESKPDKTLYFLAYNNGMVSGWVEEEGKPESRRELDPDMAKSIYEFTEGGLHQPNSDQPYRQLTTTRLRAIESQAERAAGNAR